MEVPVAVVQVQPVLQRLVIPPELVAAAHDVQVRMPVAVRVEKDRVDVLAQTVRLERGLGTHAERAVALLKKEAPRLPFGAPDVDVVQPVAIHVADRQGGSLGRQEVGDQRLAVVVVERILLVLEVDRKLLRHVGKGRQRRQRSRRWGPARSVFL